MFRNRQSHREVVELLRAIHARLGDFMSAVTDFHDQIVKMFDGISGDLDIIVEKLNAINNGPGTLSAADQAALDDALGRAKALQGKADSSLLPPPPAPPGVNPQPVQPAAAPNILPAATLNPADSLVSPTPAKTTTMP